MIGHVLTLGLGAYGGGPTPPPTGTTVSGWWHVWSAADPADPGTITKSVGDERYFGFDFGNLDELAAGESIDSAVIAVTSGGATVGATEMTSDYQVAALFAGGTIGNTCGVTCTIELSGGTTIVRTGLLAIAQGGD
jgi:hypothetical protein